MKGYSAKLPLSINDDDSVFSLNKTIPDSAKQNLKDLILTTPGERRMDKNYGVGLMKYVFSQDIRSVRTTIENKISEQVKRYLPYITINQVIFSEPNSNNDNVLYISIKYSINSLNTNDELNITI